MAWPEELAEAVERAPARVQVLEPEQEQEPAPVPARVQVLETEQVQVQELMAGATSSPIPGSPDSRYHHNP